MEKKTVVTGAKKVRYALLDELRGFMVLCMVFYHGFLSVYMIFGLDFADHLFNFFMPIEPIFAGGFILLSGLMCGFSRSNIKRGAILLVIAGLMTAVTLLVAPYVGAVEIWFGVLHLLGFSMLFCGIFGFALKKINRYVGLVASLLLFALTYGFDVGDDILSLSSIIPAEWYKNNLLFPLGITPPSFYSADYLPMIPWLFIFITGYFLFKFNIPQRFSRVFEPKRVPPLAFLGRHALIIYILHQPVIYGICMPIYYLLG